MTWEVEMVEQNETKVEHRSCPACYQPIHAKASRCPHCHCFINMGMLRAPGFTFFAGIAVTLVLLAIAIDVGLFQQFMATRESENLASQIEITSSELLLAPPRMKEEVGKRLRLLGCVKNNGAKRITAANVRVDVFNQQKELVDTFEGYIRDVEPNGTTNFRLDTIHSLHLADEEYASHTIHIASANGCY